MKEFLDLAERSFTFVDHWDDPIITSSTFRAYSKRVPIADTSQKFIAKVRTKFQGSSPGILRESRAVDMYKMNNSRSAFCNAPNDVSSEISRKTKVAETLLFFKGAIFEFTFNCRKDTFMNSSPVLLYDVPSQEDLNGWKKVKVLLFPPGWSNFDVDTSLPKDYC